jgi:hypothetical protein
MERALIRSVGNADEEASSACMGAVAIVQNAYLVFLVMEWSVSTLPNAGDET